MIKPLEQAQTIDLFVASRIRDRRMNCGLTQERLAEKLGVSFQQVQKYERASNRIGAGRLCMIADQLDVPINYFFDGASPNGTPVPTRRRASKIAIQLNEMISARPDVEQEAIYSAVKAICRAMDQSGV